MPDISRIQLPSGSVYDIKDAVARQAIAGGMSKIISWGGNSVPDVTKIPAGVVVTYNGNNYTGTLAAADGDVTGFYFVYSNTQKGNGDVYDEYTIVTQGDTKVWEKIGDTELELPDFGQLAFEDTVTLNKGDGDQVLGEGTSFTNSASAVTFSGGATDKVLGSDATFSTTVTPSTTRIKATASGGAVTASGTDTFVKSYPGTTSKLVTTTIPNVTGNTNVTIPNVTSVGTASNWTFTMGTGNDAETLIIGGGNSTTPTLGTALSASKVTLGTAITAATGGLASNGGGSSVMTGLGTATTASAVTGVSMSTQPTIALATGAAAGTGVVSVATGITSATTTVNNKDEVTAVTAVGTATAAAQVITVGTEDKVKVAKYNDLGVSVS